MTPQDLSALVGRITELAGKWTPNEGKNSHEAAAVAVVNAKLQRGIRGPDRDQQIARLGQSIVDARLQDLAPDMAQAILDLQAENERLRAEAVSTELAHKCGFNAGVAVTNWRAEAAERRLSEIAEIATKRSAYGMREMGDMREDWEILLDHIAALYEMASRDSGTALDRDLVEQFAEQITKHLSTQPAPGVSVQTDILVNRFADALKEKLRAASKKYGFATEWLESDWHESLIQQLHEHIAKGDPRDVAAYCAFAWHHGWSLSATPATSPAPAVAVGLSESERKTVEGYRKLGEIGSLVQATSISSLLLPLIDRAYPVEREKGANHG